MVNMLGGETTPPGLATTTGTVPDVAKSLARIWAVNCVALTKVVVLSSPLKRTTAPETNPEPFTVRVKAGPVAFAKDGDRLLIDALTDTFTAAELPPLGFMTVIGNVPRVSRSVAINRTVNCVALTKVVGRSEPLK
jgi:hypothetical protein